MRGPTHGDLQSDIAALRALTEVQLTNLNGRLSEVEDTQKELVRVATQGRTGLRVFLWLGGFLTAGLTAWMAFWNDLWGR